MTTFEFIESALKTPDAMFMWKDKESNKIHEPSWFEEVYIDDDTDINSLIKEGKMWEVTNIPTDETEKDFIDGFSDAMDVLFPKYSISEDCQASTPWCMPWEAGNQWFVNGKTAYEMGRIWAINVQDEIKDNWIDE